MSFVPTMGVSVRIGNEGDLGYTEKSGSGFARGEMWRETCDPGAVGC